ncbi:MAG: hypothetical protein DLM72_08245 [Candidatus Nitrosopolaris wilkensis]|nr:MAG: hypothetical protein DLM72_08245 [Candidatus Nitrosopolaris wilkensis]
MKDLTKHPKAMTLFIGSAITLVTAIGLLEQHEVYATNGANSANGANGLKGANGANGSSGPTVAKSGIFS